MTVDELRAKLVYLPGDYEIYTYSDGYQPVSELKPTPDDKGYVLV